MGCSAGTYWTGQGATSSDNCTLCGPGAYSEQSTGSTSCLSACGPGTYAEPGFCAGCYSGTFWTGTGATSSAKCSRCGAGMFSSGTGQTVCSLCQAGTYSTALGASSPAVCIACAFDQFVPLNSPSSMSSCGQCAAGTYLNSSSHTSCGLCPAGTFSTMAGNTSKACSACPTGTFSDQGQGYCSACPPGSYSNATSQSSCSWCAAGLYSSQFGSSDCMALPSQCPQGMYSSALGQSSAYMNITAQCTHCLTVCAGLTYEIRTCSAWSDRVCAPIESSLPVQVKLILLAFPFLVLLILPLFFRLAPDAVVPVAIGVLQPLRRVDLREAWAQLSSSSLLEIDANRSIRVALWTMVATSCDHLSNLFLVLLLSPSAPFNIFWVAAVSFCGSQVGRGALCIGHALV